MNSVQLIGNLGKDNDVKFGQSGNAVLNQSLAVKRSFKDKQTGEYATDWINLVMFGKTAENFANFTKKGSRVGIEGRIQTGSYDNNQGQRVYTTDVIVNQFHLLDPKQANSVGQGNQQVNNQSNKQNGYNAPKNDGFNYNGDSRMLEAQQVTVQDDSLPF